MSETIWLSRSSAVAPTAADIFCTMLGPFAGGAAAADSSTVDLKRKVRLLVDLPPDLVASTTGPSLTPMAAFVVTKSF